MHRKKRERRAHISGKNQGCNDLSSSEKEGEWAIEPSVQIYLELSTVYWDVYQLLNDTLYDDFETHVIDNYLYKKFQEAELIDWKDDPKMRLSTESGCFSLIDCWGGVFHVLMVAIIWLTFV